MSMWGYDRNCVFYQKNNGKLWMSFKQVDVMQRFFFIFKLVNTWGKHIRKRQK